MTPEEEAKRATGLLAGKVVEVIWRHRPEEIAIQFTDGSRLFANANGTSLEVSVTDASSD